MTKKPLNPLKDPPPATCSDEVESLLLLNQRKLRRSPTLDLVKQSLSPSLLQTLRRRKGNAKRAKKVTSGEDEKKTGEVTKKQAFQRLWSEEDEIALLQGMLNFRKEKGKSPYEDTNEFYEFVKKCIQFEASKNQLMEKLRSLKKKYIGTRKNESVAKTNGKSQRKTEKLDSVKQDLFSPLPNGKSVQEDLEPQKTSDLFESSFLVQSIAQFGVDEASVIQGWNSAPVESKKMIEERMRALRAKELEYLMLKIQFLHEVTSMIAQGLKQM
ncbi:hypothetical protein AALP_AAs67532U000200 [Arabis alpina]|uniref:Uncharacterized protein n=1 Tax=Arabis alpina TaxID=50452 RepID=A0A087G3Y1_ARAAL|nr:hypothetical protein AALP_AAs67532U000200 [Arabis alpina]